MFPKPKKAGAFNDIVIEFKPGESYRICCYFPGFREQFINKFFGKSKELIWKIWLDGKDVVERAGKGIIYLPNPIHLPEEIKGIHLLNLIKRLYNVPLAEVNRVKKVLGEEVLNTFFKKLEIEVKVRIIVMTAALTRGSVYIINDLIDNIIPGAYKEPEDDENKDKKGDELFYIQDLLEGKDVVLIDMSKNRLSICPDKMIYINYKKGKYYIREQEDGKV